MQSIDKPDTPTKTPTPPASAGAETSKEGQTTLIDEEDSESSPRQASQSAQTSQQQYQEHRASIASAPPCTTRRSSISTITGVCVIVKWKRSLRAVFATKLTSYIKKSRSVHSFARLFVRSFVANTYEILKDNDSSTRDDARRKNSHA